MNYRSFDRKILKRMSNFYVLTLGEFIHEEGINIALESFAGLYHDVTSKHQRKMQMTLISKGTLEEIIRKKIIDLDIQEAVEIVPWSEQKEIEEWYENASVMLIPSNGNISKLVSEAFSYGLPVICYESDDLYEVVDSTCGMMVNKNSTQQNISKFTEVLRMLYFDPEARKILKRGATRKYESQFSWGAV